MNITTALGDRVCEYYLRERVVCPINLRGGLFTTAAINNIDHNPNSTSASGPFHGTDMSLFQNRNMPGSSIDRRSKCLNLDLLPSTGRQVSELPESYTAIHPVQLKTAIAGPETSRMISEFDVALDASDNADQETYATMNGLTA